MVDTGHGQGVKALGDGVVRDDMSLRLPGYTSHGPVVPRESRDPGAVVRSTTEDWEARAAAADRAAELLQEAIMRLGQPLKQNYFGACFEGEELFTRIMAAVELWRETVIGRRNELAILAAQCRNADRSFHSADDNSAHTIAT